ncbi:MAG: hypothetical protein K2J73_06820, partial [Oscillospiraceae bacterium]|nr:hypothetical protein [Oscillospiraceae bacterium]
YMVRTSSNADLIREIDGGIKKEVSVSCTADRQICSICGTDRRVKACHHVKGRRYDGKKCFVSLEDISDAYEWSFVAVPAQIRAGVTKKFGEDIPEAEDVPDITENTGSGEEKTSLNEVSRNELETNIRRALALRCPDGCAKQVFDRICDKLEDGELEALGKILSAGKAAKTPICLDDYTMKI